MPCTGQTASYFAASVFERAEAAKACQHCPVIVLCAQAAEESGEQWGVWGGQDRTSTEHPQKSQSPKKKSHRKESAR